MQKISIQNNKVEKDDNLIKTLKTNDFKYLNFRRLASEIVGAFVLLRNAFGHTYRCSGK